MNEENPKLNPNPSDNYNLSIRYIREFDAESMTEKMRQEVVAIWWPAVHGKE